MNNPIQYVVGGAVRDILLRVESEDVDYMWTGATPEFFIRKGMAQVGSSFPVFIDHTNCEHALARIERKIGIGYHGFDCQFDSSITVEQDLLRRDLTINSLAVKYENWEEFKETRNIDLIIDPYGGVNDLQNKLLKHTSDAFREDCIRILRIARFVARYNFNIATETMELMKDIVRSNEISHLVPERVWQEFERAIMEKYPGNFILVLEQCNALNVLFPEFKYFYSGQVLINRAALVNLPFSIRIILLTHAITDNETNSLIARLPIPNDIQKLIRNARYIFDFLYQSEYFTSEQINSVLMKCGLKSSIFDELWLVISVMYDRGQILPKGLLYLKNVIKELEKVNFSSLSVEQQKVLKGKEIKEALDAIRIKIIDQISR